MLSKPLGTGLVLNGGSDDDRRQTVATMRATNRSAANLLGTLDPPPAAAEPLLLGQGDHRPAPSTSAAELSRNRQVMPSTHIRCVPPGRSRRWPEPVPPLPTRDGDVNARAVAILSIVAGRPRLVIVDRDGVLNRNLPGYVRSTEQWEWLPGARHACATLAAHRLPIAVVTNQSAVGRGLLDEAALDRIHAAMTADLAVAGVAPPYVRSCPHVPGSGCACRKPAPGLVHAVLRHFRVSGQDAVLVGDHATDIAAASGAGCWSIHVQSGRGAPPPVPPHRYLGSVADLRAAATLIVHRLHQTESLPTVCPQLTSLEGGIEA